MPRCGCICPRHRAGSARCATKTFECRSRPGEFGPHPHLDQWRDVMRQQHREVPIPIYNALGDCTYMVAGLLLMS
jgi:hypothetical protein